MATSNPNISLLPQPEQPVPIEPMRGGGMTATDASVSLLPQPSTPAPMEAMRGGGDQVGTPNVSLLPQPANPIPIEPMKGGAKSYGAKFEFPKLKLEEIKLEEIKPDELFVPYLSVTNVRAYIKRRLPIWTEKFDEKNIKKNDVLLNYNLNYKNEYSIFFVKNYEEFKKILVINPIGKTFKFGMEHERIIYIFFFVGNDNTQYSNIFRGIVEYSTKIFSNFGDIFLLAPRQFKFEEKKPEETQAINVFQTIERISLEPNIITIQFPYGRIDATRYITLSPELLFLTAYKYYNLEQTKVINIYGFEQLHKVSGQRNLIHASDHKDILIYPNSPEGKGIVPGKAYEFKNRDATFKNHYLFITFTQIDDSKTIARTDRAIKDDKLSHPEIFSFGKPFPVIRRAPTIVIKKKQRENDNEEKADDEDDEEGETELRPSRKTRIISTTSGEEYNKKKKQMNDLQKQIESELQEKDLVTINLNGVLYKIRKYTTESSDSWTKLIFTKDETQLLNDIGIDFKMLETNESEKENYDFYKSNIPPFFRDLTNSYCFQQDKLLLVEECNQIKEFLRKHYEILQNRRLQKISAYQLEGFFEFDTSGFLKSKPPTPPGLASNAIAASTPGSGPKPKENMSKEIVSPIPSKDQVWTEPFINSNLNSILSSIHSLPGTLAPSILIFDFLSLTDTKAPTTPITPPANPIPQNWTDENLFHYFSGLLTNFQPFSGSLSGSSFLPSSFIPHF